MMTVMMTPNEVADWLGMSKATIYRLCARADGLRSYKVGNRTRFKPEDVDEYLERCLVQPPQRQDSSNVVRFRYKPGMKVVSL